MTRTDVSALTYDQNTEFTKRGGKMKQQQQKTAINAPHSPLLPY